MIQIFLGQEKRFNKADLLYKYIYLYDITKSEVWIINPWTNLNKLTDSTFMMELYYIDDKRERVHKNLINWEE